MSCDMLYILTALGSQSPSIQSPRSASKKLAYPLRCLSSKQFRETDGETEHLQQHQNGPYQDLETAYVGQVCLTWEALHCQYSQMCQKVSWQPENPICYNQSAQQFQQFQVLLQRFIENEPFEKGLRAEIYARSRNTLPKLLYVPNIQGESSVNCLCIQQALPKSTILQSAVIKPCSTDSSVTRASLASSAGCLHVGS